MIVLMGAVICDKCLEVSLEFEPELVPGAGWLVRQTAVEMIEKNGWADVPGDDGRMVLCPECFASYQEMEGD